MTSLERLPTTVAPASTSEAATAGAIGFEAVDSELAVVRVGRTPIGAALKEMVAGRLWLVDLIAIAVLASAMRVIFTHAVPGPDPTYALIWGRDLIHGRTPDFTSPFASTAHPLSNVLGALAGLLGRDGAVGALDAVSYISLGAVIWGTYRLGEAVFVRSIGDGAWSRLAAATAALLVGTSEKVLGVGLGVSLDVPYLALIVWAAVVAVRTPVRGRLVLVLLTLAGLLRPEAGVLAVAYWIYALWRGDHRWASGLIILLAPLGWVAMALAVTGHPLFTVNAQGLVAHRRPGSSHVFSWSSRLSSMATALRLAIRGTALVGAVVGLLLALRRQMAVLLLPAVCAALVLLTYLAFLELGLATPDRMLLTPAAMLALFTAFAVCGWRGIHSVAEKSAWGVAGIGIAVALLATAPNVIGGLTGLDSHVAAQQRLISQLDALNRSAASRSTLTSCRPVFVGGGGLVQYVAYYLDIPLQNMGVAGVTTPARGTYLAPASREAAAQLVGSEYAQEVTAIPAGFRRVAGNRSWNVYTRGC